MSKHTSFKIGGNADSEVIADYGNIIAKDLSQASRKMS